MFSFSQQSLPDPPSAPAPYRYKVIQDPVHGPVTLPDEVLQVLDTPVFQRLRDLKQLGVANYVFPSASHSRFEHSIGVCHLAGTLLQHLDHSQPTLNITADEATCLRIAALCHDLGHGPFSHVYDGMFIPAVRPDRANWTHEEMSAQLLDLLLDDGEIGVLDNLEIGDGREIVKKMILGAKSSHGHGADHGSGAAAYAAAPVDRGVIFRDERAWLFDIVANGKSGLDVDKLDYMPRDAHALNVPCVVDPKRIIYSTRVMEDSGQLAYHVKDVMSVYEVFHQRYQLFKTIYTHRAGKAIEFMITDILAEADAAWDRRLSSAIDNPAEYAKLTDCILRQIETDKDPALHKAQSIIQKLRRRKLYGHVDEFLVPVDLTDVIPKVTAEDISTLNPDPANVDLRPADIVISDTKLNYGMGKRNPVDGCLFYSSAADTRGFPRKREMTSHLLPSVFQERIIRIYSRSDDPAKLAAMQRAFRRHLRKYGPTVTMEPEHSSRLYHTDAYATAAGDGDANMSMRSGGSGAGGGMGLAAATRRDGGEEGDAPLQKLMRPAAARDVHDFMPPEVSLSQGSVGGLSRRMRPMGPSVHALSSIASPGRHAPFQVKPREEPSASAPAAAHIPSALDSPSDEEEGGAGAPLLLSQPLSGGRAASASSTASAAAHAASSAHSTSTKPAASNGGAAATKGKQAQLGSFFAAAKLSGTKRSQPDT